MRMPAAAAVAFTLLLWNGISSAAPAPIRVATIAGSGATGFADGPARRATFLFPMGIAYDRKGNLFIADAAAQRIRVLRANGRVTTLAGGGALDSRGFWVPGGYRDGPGSVARFNRPTGVAVDSSGIVYVADADNHCIRRIDPRGSVSTFAGSPDHIGRADGARTSASFTEPLGLTLDRDGNLYVADPQSGLRRIARDGTVSTIAMGTAPLGVAVAASAQGPKIYVASATGMVIKQNSNQFSIFPSAETRRVDGQRFLQGYRTIGDTFGVAVLDEQTAVYTDPRTNTVRFLHAALTEPRIIGGRTLNDASGDTGGFKDGSSADSLFDAPTGIAIDPQGAVVVADSGNRRIRRIGPIARRTIVITSLSLLPTFNASARTYQIGFMGNSFIWQNAEWNDSIEAMIEQQLSSSRAPRSLATLRLKPNVSAIAAGSKADAAEQYLQTVTGLGHLYDAIVLDVNSVTVAQSFGIPEEELPARTAEWSDKLSMQIQRIDQMLRQARIPLLIVTHPMPYQLSAGEGAWAALERNSMEPDARVGDVLNTALNKSGAEILNLWPAFMDAEAAPNHPPLFMTEDPHFTEFGRAIVAKGIADALERRRPWLAR